MLSRRAAKSIADTYHTVFTYTSVSYGGTRPTQSKFTFYQTQLYDFLYIHEFDSWFLNSVKSLSTVDRRAFREFIMRLHTGESVVRATPELDFTTFGMK
jgi:hypothetical protein